MKHAVFQEELFDEAEYVGEVRKRRTSHMTPFQATQLMASVSARSAAKPDITPVQIEARVNSICPPHHWVREPLMRYDVCRNCGSRVPTGIRMVGES